jgi:radical SAM protein with 4Fe4S-binding SPASM domain
MKKFNITWDITERCNKRCRHCYINAENLSELNFLELDHALTKIDSTLKQWGKIGFFAFTGGEALLRKDDLLPLMEKADILPNIGYYQLLSNGSLISEEIVKELLRFRKLGAVQLSMESSSSEVNDSIRGEGSFEETLRAIKELKGHQFKTSLSTTISQVNCRDIPALINWADHVGVDEIGFDRLIPYGNGKNLPPLSKQELRQVYGTIYKLASKTKKVKVVMRRPLFCLIAPEEKEIGAMCSAGFNNLSIMPDGTIYPCRWLPLPLGNITTVDLDYLWHNTDLLAKLRKKNARKGKCHGCPFLAKCGGCRGMAYFYNGDYLAEDPQCWR